jgi:LPXTG-motif cell wall-anchored protein
MTSTGKIITWTAVIGVVAIGSYIGYAAYKKKKEEEAAGTPKISAADAQSIGAGLGSFIKNLFAKTPATTETTASSATGKVKHPKSVGTRGLIY